MYFTQSQVPYSYNGGKTKKNKKKQKKTKKN